VGLADEYPAIKAFVRGYLHQDAVAEYGSAQGAAEDFCHDADRNQLDRLRSEWDSFRSRHSCLDDVNKGLQQLGSAWQFQSAEEFRQMIEIFHDKAGQSHRSE